MRLGGRSHSFIVGLPPQTAEERIRKHISLRIDRTMLYMIRQLSVWKRTPYQTLIHQWLAERTNAEWTAFKRAQSLQGQSTPPEKQSQRRK